MLGHEVQRRLDVHVAVGAVLGLPVPTGRAAVGLAPAVIVAGPLDADSCRVRTRLLCAQKAVRRVSSRLCECTITARLQMVAT